MAVFIKQDFDSRSSRGKVREISGHSLVSFFPLQKLVVHPEPNVILRPNHRQTLRYSFTGKEAEMTLLNSRLAWYAWGCYN